MKGGGTLQGFTGKLLCEISRRLLLKQYYDLEADGAKRVKLKRRSRILLTNNVLHCTNRTQFYKANTVTDVDVIVDAFLIVVDYVESTYNKQTLILVEL